ncbi:MAG: type II toxin-antitoxin system VapC family toxin [Acidobacteria bacterium]|nr:MAG: type II toxin-antitoxin system VapC family toxin [Acidobacteriota bacterium]REK06098.1 MAG: type II toxin-antitoxin system VapC family toxin [Acidobacteriota bacterium]
MFLVDTNVLSELLRPRPDEGVLAWANELPPPLRISVVTLEEVRFGLAARPNQRIERRFERLIEESAEVLPVTAEIAGRAGALRGALRRDGIQRTQADMFIAATALAHQLMLATRNVRDFEGCGISVVNPFSE